MTSGRRPDTTTYTTAGGIHVTRQRQAIDAHAAIAELIDQLDTDDIGKIPLAQL